MIRVLTVIAGALAEAWGEVRVNRGRVILSLVGVTVAVASLTAVVGFGSYTSAANTAISERFGGRAATFQLSVSPAEGSGAGLDPSAAATAFRAATARYGIEQATVVLESSRRAQFADGVRDVTVREVDRPWGTVHANTYLDGGWFTARDAERLAPGVVVNEAMWKSMGSPALRTHPTMRVADVGSKVPNRLVVLTGVLETGEYETEPTMYLLASTSDAPASADSDSVYPGFELWIPEHGSQALADRVASDMVAALDGVDATAGRIDAGAFAQEDPGAVLTPLIAGVSVLVLLLGAFGLLGVSLVSVRQRIREIGIRRGVGATAPRVFVAVMLENVVGTALAGGVGVMVGALLMGLPSVRESLTYGLPIALPPFPIGAALLGLASSVTVGALSGLVPALVAVRVRVIDAIRF